MNVICPMSIRNFRYILCLISTSNEDRYGATKKQLSSLMVLFLMNANRYLALIN